MGSGSLRLSSRLPFALSASPEPSSVVNGSDFPGALRGIEPAFEGRVLRDSDPAESLTLELVGDPLTL